MTATHVRLSTFLLMGALFWFMAAMFIRFFGNMIFVPGSGKMFALFLATIPDAFLLVIAGVRLGRADRKDALPAVSLMALAALLLDGIAITWFPQLYGLPLPSLLLAATWLLWGVGLCLAVAYYFTYHHRSV